MSADAARRPTTRAELALLAAVPLSFLFVAVQLGDVWGNLPAHPLLLHVPVVLLPLVALCAIAGAVHSVARAWRIKGWPASVRYCFGHAEPMREPPPEKICRQSAISRLSLHVQTTKSCDFYRRNSETQHASPANTRIRMQSP